MGQVPESQGASPAARPSVSAYNVASCRAVAAYDPRESIRGPDTLAEIFLTDEARQSLRVPAVHEAIRGKLAAASPGGYEFFIARTAYIDDVMAQALRENIPQIVLLGAGYDTRACRLSDLIQDTRIFELDTPVTQGHKRSLLAKAQVAEPDQLTYIALDFTREDIADRLVEAGYARDRRTLFIWEGVTYYLPPQTVEATFDFVRRNSPAGSVLCFDYMLAASDLAHRFGAVQSRQMMLTMYTDEPLCFDLDQGHVAEFLTERGFALVEHVTTAMMQERYLTLPDGTLAGQVLDLFGLVRAEVVG